MCNSSVTLTKKEEWRLCISAFDLKEKKSEFTFENEESCVWKVIKPVFSTSPRLAIKHIEPF